MLTPRAADDFEIIRGRLEELRRERARISSETGDDRSVTGPKSSPMSYRRPASPPPPAQHPPRGRIRLGNPFDTGGDLDADRLGRFSLVADGEVGHR
jgi:hypothetical protein